MILNTEVLSLNKFLLTPHSYQNFLQLLTFRNILLEHLLLGIIFGLLAEIFWMHIFTYLVEEKTRTLNNIKFYLYIT